METRVGVVGIVIESLEAAPLVNHILHEHAEVIVGRMGVPYKEKGLSIISLIVDGNMDQLSSMTGKLGRIAGVTVKSAITKK
ncbi:MAG: TM1266 family iron-only hydrogenase system putative regulator [Cellulosilyticaceae bacterium]